ncbi:MAG: hypothetical protein WB785_13690 [Mycobacterium sp.]|uniref:hypothetical protein n=1 Tax=Mycobacterium sp. TaxID=1785 RepID=UPI003C38750D
MVGLSLALSDSLDKFSNFNLGFVVRLQDVINLLIAIMRDTCQFFAQVHHTVERALKGRFVGAVLVRDVGGLVGALLKCIPDGVGGHPLLPSQACCNGLLQCVMKLGEVCLDRSTISNSMVKRGHRRDTHPLRANQQRRPFTGWIIGHSHLHTR